MVAHEFLISFKDWAINTAAATQPRKPNQVHYKDNMSVDELLKKIGEDQQWSESQVDNDTTILQRNRLYSVRDLRDLSDESWEIIELLPFVRDILRDKICPDWRENLGKDTKDGKKKKKDKIQKRLKKEKKRAKREREEREEREYELSLYGNNSYESTLRAQFGMGSYARQPQIPTISREEIVFDDETIRNTLRNKSIDVDPSIGLAPKSSDETKPKKSVSFPEDLDLIMAGHKKEIKKAKKKRAKKELKKARREACRKSTKDTIKRLEQAKKEREATENGSSSKDSTVRCSSSSSSSSDSSDDDDEDSSHTL
ncbi:hypothetical protein CLU79DRAFT_780702 [Phycomyces nitens]|nr:hypothetical protein CLU79DRAFT_780702 [Phycomyces nitens]